MEPAPPKISDDKNEFKKSEKFYKHFKGKKTDFSQVIDFTSAKTLEELKIHKEIRKMSILGLEKEFQVYTFSKPSGFVVVKDFLPLSLQLKIANDAMNEYVNKPHRTNMFIYEKTDPVTGEILKGKEFEIDPQSVTNDSKKFFFNSRVRWANIGYQYNWDARNYFETRSEIPIELKEIAKMGVEFLELKSYNPEAVIVNYYGKKNVMGGHLDDGEPDQIHPIVSYSLGLSCVFLIGGQTKEEKPLAVRLDNGDLCLMSGEARRCFHGVPRVLEGSYKQEESARQFIEANLKEEMEDKPRPGPKNFFGLEPNRLIHTVRFLKENRININFRQVILEPEPILKN